MTEQALGPEESRAALAGGVRGVAPVHNLLDRQDRNLRWSLLGNILLGVALSASVFGHAWTAINPPKPEYFATTADGRIIPLVPISEPYVAPEVLLTWTSQAVTKAYTLNHIHYKEQLSSMRELFTAQGFRAHEAALKAAGIPETLQKYRAITQVVSTAPPIITNQGIIAGRYAWSIKLPIQITYQGASSVSAPQTNTVELLVVRVPTNELPRGYAIHQIVTHPGSEVGR